MKKLKITGLDCAHCAAKLEHALQHIEGIKQLTVDFMGQKIVYESEVDTHTLIHKMQEIANQLEDGIIIENEHHHKHEHHECGCDHHHHAHKDHECDCGHHHEEHECGCEHSHEHHHEEHEHHECGCGHHHHAHKDHECGCEHHHVYKETKKFIVEGLDCANCAAKLEHELQKIDGVQDLTVDFMGQKIVYSSILDELVVMHKLQEVTDKVEPGVMIRLQEENKEKTASVDWMVVRIVLSFILLGLSFTKLNYSMWFAMVGYIVIGYDIILRSIKNISKGQWMDENFLMMIATFGAFYVKEVHEACGVMLFYQVGEYFQNLAVNRSRDSISSLLDLRPDSANLKHGDHVHTVHPEKLKEHDVIVVYPSEKIPVDGIIIDGNSSLDMSMLTGESLPQEKGINDTVMSGSINLVSTLTIEVTKVYAESTAYKILDLVENASSQKADAEKFITKFARYYTPIVVGIALLLLLVLPMLNLSFTDAMYRACIFLVVSCPCALVISIPLSFFGGIGGASAKGILLKGGNYLETLTNIDTFVFDKTGTITTGTFVVTDVVSEYKDILKMCAHIESHSMHPIAQSIVKAYEGDIDESLISNVQELSGFGLLGLYGGKELVVGNIKLMNEHHIDCPKVDEIGTIVYVGYEDVCIGYLVIQDEIKENSKEVIAQLHHLGLHTVMLSGDAKSIVEDVGCKVGIQQCFGELLPQDKVQVVEELLESGKKVAFVGDGMNDAPVLARADVGIAMGERGSDAAIEVADVIIMQDSLDKLIVVKRIAQKTMRVVKENIVLALSVKIIVMLLSTIGVANMWLAVFADVGVALLAILNAIRVMK